VKIAVSARPRATALAQETTEEEIMARNASVDAMMLALALALREESQERASQVPAWRIPSKERRSRSQAKKRKAKRKRQRRARRKNR